MIQTPRTRKVSVTFYKTIYLSLCLFTLFQGRIFAAPAPSDRPISDEHKADEHIASQSDKQNFPKPTLSELLGGMGASLNSGNYAMSFVFIHDGQIDSLRYSHLTTQSDRFDKLERLQGSKRMIISQNGDSYLVMDNEKIHLAVDDGSPVKRWKNQLRRLAKNIKNYHVNMSGISRIAGRLAFELNFIAINEQRYSTRLWLDSLTYLPLRIDSLNSKGKIIEQMLAIDLQYPANLTDANFLIDDNLTQLVENPVLSDADLNESQWNIGWLPLGYEMTLYQKNHSDKVTDSEQWVYSDGLTSLSIFIETNRNNKNRDITHKSKSTFIRGDTLIYDLKTDATNFTVIGDVPVKTAEKIATSIKPKISKDNLDAKKLLN